MIKNKNLESIYKITEIRLNGEGTSYSHLYGVDENYKLINIIIDYYGSDDGRYRVDSIQQVNTKDYLIFLSNSLNTDSYITGYMVLMKR